MGKEGREKPGPSGFLCPAGLPSLRLAASRIALRQPTLLAGQEPLPRRAAAPPHERKRTRSAYEPFTPLPPCSRLPHRKAARTRLAAGRLRSTLLGAESCVNWRFPCPGPEFFRFLVFFGWGEGERVVFFFFAARLGSSSCR